jgi:putative DNA primase/helicase
VFRGLDKRVHFTPVQLPVSYDPAATCPETERFASQVFPSDATMLAWEIVAWLMLPNTSIQRAVLLTGEGANGKSTWLRQVETFLGKSNVSAVPLHRLESCKFSVARLVGKLANVCADLPSAHLAGTSTFKAITGGDFIQAEYKFRDSFDLLPFARLVFSANHPPRSQDASPAFFRRWLVVPFNRTFAPGQQIPREILDAVLALPGELSGLLNKALDALRSLQAGGFSEPASVKEAQQEFQVETDPLSVWLQSNTSDDPNATERCDHLRQRYNEDAQKEGRYILSAKAFGSSIRRLRPGVVRQQKTIDGRQTWVYVGIGM